MNTGKHLKQLLCEFVKKGIRLKYRSSFLGIIWSFFEPLLSIWVYVLVFGTLFQRRDPEFVLYVSCGKLLYSFFSSGTQNAGSSITSNAEILKKVYVPQFIYPLSEILWHYSVFLISLLVLVPLILWSGFQVTLRVLWILPALALLLLLTAGTGLILACGEVYFRDIEHIWRVMLMLIMYVSAVFYYPDQILKSDLWFLLRFNPLYEIITLFRCGILNTAVDAWMLLYPLSVSVIVLAVGICLFRKHQRSFVLYV